MTMTHLFLSPHFDDAVYSCGGLIHQLTRAGQRAHVITLMAGEPLGPPPDTPILRDLAARWSLHGNPVAARAAEDRAALDRLGATYTHLGIPDCIYRTADNVALYPTEAALWDHVHPDDDAAAHLNSLTDMITPSVGAATTTVYAPLAVGGHVDHLIVNRWAVRLARSNAHLRLRFYTDFPYLRQADAVQAALDRVGVALRPDDVPLADADLTARIHAMRAYTSQISTFWQDSAAMAADVRRSLQRDDGSVVERYWHPA